ncbi:hypothetical protein C10C_0737 [Chlamydia serpentis]|uniref:Uncharacterized protein n=1 Tax=Chlamydia serpentis TaxID=1967782 RepID=A0A2R8FC06_9CHLA|nr:hypothetical protein [Chlamydia serpentis]SPN73881.1 hypothetical protein C10C_0737 [Chlamydia serpentis]
MKFKLPVYHIGLTKAGNNTIKIAILQKTCKGWIVCHCEQIAEGETWPLPKKYFSASTTFSLQGSDILVKGSFSSLRNKKNILKVALTNLEASLALPWESLIVQPQLGSPTDKGETPLTLWIAQKNTLKKDLSFLSEAQVFPNQLSSRTADIFFLAEQSPLKTLPIYFLIYVGSEETTCIFVKNHAIIVARSFPNCSMKKSCDDIYATLQYIQETFPNTVLSTIHIAHASPSLKKSLEQKLTLPLVICQSMTYGIEDEDWEIYGDSIAAAYHGASKKPLTFTYDTTSISRSAKKHWLLRSSLLIGKCALFATIVVGIGSALKLKALSSCAGNHFSLACPEEGKLPKSLKAAEKKVEAVAMKYSSLNYPLLPTIPTSEQTLKFLLALTKITPSVKFSYFSYTMTSYPSQENPSLPYTALIEVKGQGLSEEISQFLKKVSSHPKLHHFSGALEDEQSFKLKFTLSS